MTFPAMMYGGPEDGKTYALHTDDMIVRFVVMVGPPILATMDEDSAPTSIETDYLQYLRTKQFASNGARIYRYVPNG